MTTVINPAIKSDSALLETYVRSHFDEAPPPKRGWHHMGQVIVDATFQPRRNYEKVVRPKVELIAELCPDPSLSGFRKWLGANDARLALRYNYPEKIRQLHETASAFAAEGVETVEDLRVVFSSAERRGFRRAISAVRLVGPKTLDYFEVLVGLQEAAAVDVRVRRAMRKAGIEVAASDYARPRAIMEETAAALGWPLGSLDAALWQLS